MILSLSSVISSKCLCYSSHLSRALEQFVAFFTHITSLSKLKWLIFTGKEIYFPKANLPFCFCLVEPSLLHTLYGSARTGLKSEDVYLWKCCKHITLLIRKELFMYSHSYHTYLLFSEAKVQGSFSSWFSCWLCYHKIKNDTLEQAEFPLCGSGANENQIASLCHCESSAALHNVFWWTTATVAQPCLAASRCLAVLMMWSQHMLNQLNSLRRTSIFKARCWLNCSQLLPSPETAQHF